MLDLVSVRRVSDLETRLGSRKSKAVPYLLLCSDQITLRNILFSPGNPNIVGGKMSSGGSLEGSSKPKVMPVKNSPKN